MRKIAIIAALAAAVAAQPALAGEKTSDMEVTLNVLNSCTLTAPESLAFGDLTSLVGASATGTATVNCTIDAGYTLDIGDGDNFATGTRHMTNGVTDVPYTIEIDGGSDSAIGVGTGADETYDLEALLSTTSVPQGSYADTVVVSLTY